MLHTNQFSLLGLGVVVSIGMGFLLWTLFHLCCEAHPRLTAKGRPFRHRI
jgi:hypothetical protein